MRQFSNENSHPEDDTFHFGFMQNNPTMMEGLQGQQFEVSSSHSSLNHANKYSVENVHTSDFEGSDKLYDEEMKSQIKSPSLIKKNISKKYEPIIYNGVVFKYEDDPAEYRKARKRNQNRVSATRVRNKKKTYVEELESEIETLKEENNDLRTRNNVLATENTLLKQQVAFFERLVMNTPKPAPEYIQEPQPSPPQEVQIDVGNLKDDNPVYYRAVPSSKIKMHTAFLGILTVLICLSGALSEKEEICLSTITSGVFGGNTVSAYTLNKFASKEYSMETQPHLDVLPPLKIDPDILLILTLKMTFVLLYVMYTIYVVSITHRHFCKT